MNLYLLQHGQSVPEEVDGDRPLSDQGREDNPFGLALHSYGIESVFHAPPTTVLLILGWVGVFLVK